MLTKSWKKRLDHLDIYIAIICKVINIRISGPLCHYWASKWPYRQSYFKSPSWNMISYVRYLVSLFYVNQVLDQGIRWPKHLQSDQMQGYLHYNRSVPLCRYWAPKWLFRYCSFAIPSWINIQYVWYLFLDQGIISSKHSMSDQSSIHRVIECNGVSIRRSGYLCRYWAPK